MNLERCDDRIVPALFDVGLMNPGSGSSGNAAATFSGSLSVNPSLPTAGMYSVRVEADSAAEALERALVGTISAQFNGETMNYAMGPGAVGTAASEHKPFLFEGGMLRLEDMAYSANGSDWDYDDRYFYVSVAPASGGSTPPTPPTVSIAAGAGTAEGGSTDGTFLFTRTGATGAALTVYCSAMTGSGAATHGSDYTAVGSTFGTVTFAAGSATATVVLHAVDDALVEGPETIGLTLTSSMDGLYQLDSAAAYASIGLADNDSGGGGGGPQTVSIAGGADTVEGGSLPGSFVFTRTGDNSASLTVSTMAWTGGTNTATAGADYTSAGTATFAAGSSTATLLIHAIDDSFIEGTETIGLYVIGGSGYQVDMMAYAANIALLDNDAAGTPVAVADAYDVRAGQTLTGNVLANDTAPGGGSMTASTPSITSQGGSVTLAADGRFTYTAATGFRGADSFTYTATGSDGTSSTALVNLTVSNNPPLAPGGTFFVTTDGSLSGTVTGGASDADGDALTYSLVSGPSHGTVAVSANGAFTYAPVSGFAGADAFVFGVADGHGGSTSSTIRLVMGELGSVVGTVFEDLNENGAREGREEGLEGFTVRLVTYVPGTEVIVATQVTGATGYFSFTPPDSGQYRLRVIGTDGLPVIGAGNGIDALGYTPPFAYQPLLAPVQILAPVPGPPVFKIVRNDTIPDPDVTAPMNSTSTKLYETIKDGTPGFELIFDFKSEIAPNNSRRIFVVASRTRTVLVHTDGTAQYIVGSDADGYKYFTEATLQTIEQTSTGVYSALKNVAPATDKVLLFVYHEDETTFGLSGVWGPAAAPAGNPADTKAKYETFKDYIAKSVSAKSAYVYYNPPAGVNKVALVDAAMGKLKPGPTLEAALLTLKGTQGKLELDKAKLEAFYYPAYINDTSKPLIVKQ